MSTCRDVRRLPSLLCCEGRDYFFPVLFDFNVFSLLPTGGGPACVARRAPPPAASPAPARRAASSCPRSWPGPRAPWSRSDSLSARLVRHGRAAGPSPPVAVGTGCPSAATLGMSHVAVLRLAVAGGLCGSTEFPFSRRSAFVFATARGPREPQTSPQFCASLPTAVREPAPLGEKCPPHPRPR